MTTPPTPQDIWGSRAERLLQQALDEAQSGLDAIPTAAAALAALRIEAGELPAEELDGYPFPDEEVPCTCPPDLRERGGFTSDCRAHGTFSHRYGTAQEDAR